jgi:hypothetical protein
MQLASRHFSWSGLDLQRIIARIYESQHSTCITPTLRYPEYSPLEAYTYNVCGFNTRSTKSGRESWTLVLEEWGWEDESIIKPPFKTILIPNKCDNLFAREYLGMYVYVEEFGYCGFRYVEVKLERGEVKKRFHLSAGTIITD